MEVRSVVYKLLEVMFLMFCSPWILLRLSWNNVCHFGHHISGKMQCRENPEESSRNDKSCGKCDLLGKVEGLGFV